jgi:histone H3/H4
MARSKQVPRKSNGMMSTKSTKRVFNAGSKKTFVLIDHKALGEIRRLQQETEKPMCAKAAFKRVVHEVMDDVKSGMRIQKKALHMLQSVAEDDFLHKHFEQAACLAAHAGRNTITVDDTAMIKLLDRIRDAK